MPYREDSHSPPRRHLERSASPERGRSDAAGPSKKARMGPNDVQRRHLEKLLQNPDREIQMPTGPVEKALKPPPEMVKNVQASAAAAGSGEFHVYKHSRRREFERLKQMESKDRAEAEQKDFMARQAARDAEADAKTAKNRAKRLKRKGRKGDGDGTKGSGATAAGGPGGGDTKRKLAGGGAGVLTEHAGDGEESGDEEGPTIPVPIVAAAPLAPVAAEHREIIIHDDD